jgi:hypothetical protein
MEAYDELQEMAKWRFRLNETSELVNIPAHFFLLWPPFEIVALAGGPVAALLVSWN